MNVETNPHNYTNMKDTFSQFFKPARIPPKEISGVNGKLLPKPSFSYTGVWGGIRAGESKFQKTLAEFLRILFPRKIVSQKFVRFIDFGNRF